ncbi:vitamin K epoxide reductase family protein [Streptomyces sp. NPDC018833]|uniref:vitamin K epoxide reductase family protein n=1 Tax=Streptomyces sp. NPDC018833 TaxID=3365053 RepID=UPI0037B53440
MTATATDIGPGPRSAVTGGRGIGLLMVVIGVIGWLASFQLTVEDWQVLKNPRYQPGCNISPVVGCGSVISSWQGNIFGFPNMLLGLGAFAAVTAFGAVLLTGGRLHRSLWLALNAGALAGVVMVHWLIQQSLYELGRLCPYCAVVWVITIALFWYVTLRNLNHEVIQVTGRSQAIVAALTASHWIVLLTWYVIIAVLVLTRFWNYWTTVI